MFDPFAEFTKHVLPNKLEVHTFPMERPWIIVEIVIHTGGREDPPEFPGLAHFVEHMVSENIPHIEFEEAKAFFDSVGGRTGFGGTSYQATRYKFTVPADIPSFKRALSIFGSMLLEAKMEQCLEQERKVIHREFIKRAPFPAKMKWEMDIRQSLFKGHSLEKWDSALGRPEGFLSASQADLQSFYDRHYVPANMSLVVVGGLPMDQVIAELQKSPFGIEKEGVRIEKPKPFLNLPTPDEISKTVSMSDYVSFKLEVAEYKAVWALPTIYPKQAVRIFDLVLGKILYAEIRVNRGLAYSISTGPSDYHDVFEYVITCQIPPSASEMIDDLMRKCIQIVPTRPDFFERMLKSRKQQALMLDVSGSELADYSAVDLKYEQRIVPMQEVVDGLEKVTMSDMAKGAEVLNTVQPYVLITNP